MTRRIFVYGTLGPGGPNEHVLIAIGGTFEKATVRGCLMQRGWGAEMGYPGIRLDDAGDTIDGYLFCSDNLESHWEKLDEFEGKEYRRVLTEVNTENGSTVEAYTYVLREHHDHE